MAILAVIILLVSRAVPHKEIYADVNWSIVFLIAGMLVVGMMLEETGTARQMAMGIAGSAEHVPGWMIVSVTYLGAMILTELISNNAVAVMFTPVAINLANELGVEPRPLIMAVLFATSASFATPVGYQTNTLIYGVGGYRFSDFVRVGLPLNVILWIVASILIPWFLAPSDNEIIMLRSPARCFSVPSFGAWRFTGRVLLDSDLPPLLVYRARTQAKEPRPAREDIPSRAGDVSADHFLESVFTAPCGGFGRD